MPAHPSPDVDGAFLAHALQSVEWPPTRRGSRPFDPVREAGARTDNALFAPACSSPPSVALRPRVAARSSMSGASWCGDEGGSVRTLIQSPQRELIDERERPWPRRSARAFQIGADGRQSSIAARTRSVTSAAFAFHANDTAISTSGYDVTRTANSRRSAVATIQPSNLLLKCLPAATTAASSSALRSRGIVAESKIAIGIISIIAASLALELITPLHTGALIATFRPAAPARSSMSGVSWKATEATHNTRAAKSA